MDFSISYPKKCVNKKAQFPKIGNRAFKQTKLKQNETNFSVTPII